MYHLKSRFSSGKCHSVNETAANTVKKVVTTQENKVEEIKIKAKWELKHTLKRVQRNGTKFKDVTIK